MSGYLVDGAEWLGRSANALSSLSALVFVFFLSSPTVLEAQTKRKPDFEFQYSCARPSGTLAGRAGEILVYRAPRQAGESANTYSIGTGTECFVTFRADEFEFSQLGEPFEFNSYDEKGPVPINFEYEFLNDFIDVKLGEIRKTCSSFDNIALVKGYSATRYSLCVERRARKAISATRMVVFFLEETEFRQTIQVFASSGEIIGIGVEAWDREEEFNYSEYSLPKG